MSTVRMVLRSGARVLEAVSPDQPHGEAEWLLADALGCSRLDLYREPRHQVPPVALLRYQDLLFRRSSGEPLQYLRRREEFYGLEFDISPAVLIPRPETELMVDEAVAFLGAASARRGDRSTRSVRFADIGTGSGCVAISVANRVPLACGLAVDCSPEALAVARHNVRRHGLDSRVQCVQGDLCGPLRHWAEGPCDLIMANLPYIPAADMAGLAHAVRDYEPHLALDGGADGLTLLQRLLQSAAEFLGPGGRLLLEVGAGQYRRASEYAVASGWRVTAVVRDLAGIDRLLVCERGSGGVERKVGLLRSEGR